MTAANGLKHLFTKDEIDKTIQLAIQNGWTSPEETNSYNSQINKNRLNKISNKINNMRAQTPKPLGKRKKAKI